AGRPGRRAHPRRGEPAHHRAPRPGRPAAGAGGAAGEVRRRGRHRGGAGRGVLRIGGDRRAHDPRPAPGGPPGRGPVRRFVERLDHRSVPAGRHGGAAVTTLVAWDETLLSYDLGDHPFNPVRVELTVAPARDLGVLSADGVRVVAPEPADDATLLRVHTADYLAAVKAAPD